MAPPLIQLKDIALTFGGTPLLTGVELSVSAGERVCLVGRNGSGKSTLLKIAAGLVEPDGGSASSSPARPSAICRRSRTSAATRPRSPMSRPASAPATIHYQARYLLEQLGLTGDEDPAHALRRRGAPRGAGARAGALARHPAARRADQPSRSADHRMAGRRTRQPPLRARHDQPRPPLPLQPVARHRLARSRPDAAHRPRLRRVRGLARRGAGGGRARPAQARPQDRRRGALAALRRLRPAQAQRQAARQSARAARRSAATTAARPATPASRRPRPTSPASW